MILDTTTKKLQIVLAGAVATTQPSVTASWADMTPSALVGGASNTVANGATAVDVVAAPAASTQRQVKYLSIYNGDTASVTVTVQLNNSATLVPMYKVTLAVGYTLTYTPEGWRVTDTNGALVSTSAGGGGVTLSNTSAWLKNQFVAPTVNSSATGTVTPDASASNNFDYLLTGALTIANPTNLSAGMVLNFRLKQDATGGRTIAFGTAFKWPGGTVPTWATTANAINFFSAYYDSASGFLLCNGGTGYA